MNTVEFFQNLWAWELADVAHPVITAAFAVAVLPKPDPSTPFGRVYQVVHKAIDMLALNVFNAKTAGVPSGIAGVIETEVRKDAAPVAKEAPHA